MVTAAQETLTELLEQAASADEDAAALEKLLEAWRLWRAPAIADVIELVSARLDGPPSARALREDVSPELDALLARVLAPVGGPSLHRGGQGSTWRSRKYTFPMD